MRKVLLMVILILSVLFWNSYLTKKTRDNAPPIKEAGSEKITKQNNKTASSLVKFEDAVFPENFFFGSAYSDFQTAGISKASDWHEYIQNIKSPLVGPGIANDLFNRYQEDFDLAGEIGIQVHRISLDWARCEPEEGKFDKACIEKWKEIGRYMKSKGIQLMICLNHFPHPKWFAELGGWENVKAPYYYARYAEFIARNIGVPLETKWWLTYNEPQFVISIPYGKGGWPPFKTVENFADIKGTERFLKVAGNVMDGHLLAYRAIHKVMDSSISQTMSVHYITSYFQESFGSLNVGEVFNCFERRPSAFSVRNTDNKLRFVICKPPLCLQGNADVSGYEFSIACVVVRGFNIFPSAQFGKPLWMGKMIQADHELNAF